MGRTPAQVLEDVRVGLEVYEQDPGGLASLAASRVRREQLEIEYPEEQWRLVAVRTGPPEPGEVFFGSTDGCLRCGAVLTDHCPACEACRGCEHEGGS